MTDVGAHERAEAVEALRKESPMAAPALGGTPEMDIALDLVKRALPVVPMAIAFGALLAGWSGAISATYALALVVVNFLVAAWMMTVAARISVGLLMASVLFGYVLRLGLILGATLLVVNTSWFEALPFGITLIAAHLGLLAWETKFVSASLAYPGLKPSVTSPDHTSDRNGESR